MFDFVESSLEIERGEEVNDEWKMDIKTMKESSLQVR
jgi:hypothetical protein